jgi:hypothetical protein
MQSSLIIIAIVSTPRVWGPESADTHRSAKADPDIDRLSPLRSYTSPFRIDNFPAMVPRSR